MTNNSTSFEAKQSTSSSSSSSSSRTAETDTGNIASSTTNSPEIDLIIKHITSTKKPQTVGQIKATGEVKLVEAEAKKIVGDIKHKTIVLVIIGIIAISLTLFGCSVFIWRPEISKDVWVVIGPIIIACTSGTIGFLTGEKHNANNQQ